MLTLTDNRNVQGIKCINDQDNPIRLMGGAFSGCSSLQFLHGNFTIMGTRVFLDCASLTLNSPSIYSNYPVLQYPVPFIDDP
jgi:hypothetical protein